MAFMNVMFFLYGTEDPLSQLTINVSGGCGGVAQDGGHGGNGENGVPGSLDSVRNRNKSVRIERREAPVSVMRQVFTANTLFKDTYRSGTMGKPGGNAGSGGYGGRGGDTGTVVILKGASPLSCIKRISNMGARGSHGKHGQVGLGGINGPIFEGVYDVHKAYAEFRPSLHDEVRSSGGSIALRVLLFGGIQAVGTAFNQLADEWDTSPHMLTVPARALNGNAADSYNVQGIQSAVSKPITDADIDREFQNYKARFADKICYDPTILKLMQQYGW